jgi:hypothetical protein
MVDSFFFIFFTTKIQIQKKNTQCNINSLKKVVPSKLKGFKYSLNCFTIFFIIFF